MAKRIGPEAKIITLFTALSTDSQRIVLDIIKSQTATTGARKQAVSKPPKVDKQPTLKEVPKVERCTVCGNEEDYQDHFEPSPNYHVFQGKKAKGAA